MGTLAADTFTAGNASISLYAQQTALDDIWHLWSYYSWKDVAVSSTFILTAALLGHVAANTGSSESWSFARGAVGFGVGFFVPRTATKYPTIKYQNTIRTDILSLYCSIGKKLINCADRYTTPTESPELVALATLDLDARLTTETEQLIGLIKRTAKLCYELSLNKNITQELLLEIRSFIKEIDKKVGDLITSLDNNPPDTHALLISEAKQFWQQDFEEIREQLEANDELENNESLNLPPQMH